MRFVEYIKLRYRAGRYKGRKDPGEISYVLSTVKVGDIVLDIGAHKAGYLYFFRKQVGDKGHIYAFEPQTRLFTYLQKLKRIFGWNNVTIEQLALSNKQGNSVLYVPVTTDEKTSSPGATIVSHPENSDFKPLEEIQTDTLDTYCSTRLITPDFIKIDVEGNELPLLQGGVETLRKSKPKIIVEIEARHVGIEMVLETFEFMKKLGYIGYFIHGQDRRPIELFDVDFHQNVNDMKNYSNNFIFE